MGSPRPSGGVGHAVGVAAVGVGVSTTYALHLTYSQASEPCLRLAYDQSDDPPDEFTIEWAIEYRVGGRLLRVRRLRLREWAPHVPRRLRDLLLHDRNVFC